jgi:GntR family transcriptional repressor for pyruvate dehydrogenase complex
MTGVRVDGKGQIHDHADMPKPSSSKKQVRLPRVSPEKDDVTQGLITQFQQMLRDGRLSQGDRLPPERELAAHFNVARSSLRQALKVLEILGVITQRVGDGSYLNSDVAAILSVPLEFLFLLDDTTVEDLTELRLLMEPGLARLAAQRATEEEIAMLRQSILDLEASASDKLKLVSSDLLFHRAIFQASKNRTAGNLFHNIHRAMAKMMLVTSQLVELEHTLAFHKPIMRAIEKGDGDLAAKLMKEHLEDARALLIGERDHQPKATLGTPVRKGTTGRPASKPGRPKTVSGVASRRAKR